MDLSTLLVAQQFTGTANFQIVRGQQVAGAQLSRRLYSFQALAGVRADRGAGRAHKVGIGLVVGAADPTTQLVQLGKSKLVSALNDNGVRVGDVDARLNDGGAQQDMVPLMVEGGHHLFQLGFAHLAVVEGRDSTVVLRINSPGGGVAATDMMWRELTAFRQHSGRPVVACLMDVATGGDGADTFSINETVDVTTAPGSYTGFETMSVSTTGNIGAIKVTAGTTTAPQTQRATVTVTAASSGQKYDVTIGGVKYYETNKIRKPQAKKLMPIIIR